MLIERIVDTIVRENNRQYVYYSAYKWRAEIHLNIFYTSISVFNSQNFVL